jgi:hypothetical protein
MTELRFSSRLLLGALAGLTATTAMTATMRRLHARLPTGERYPLPPREITERVMPGAGDELGIRDRALVAHFAYGAATGALIAAAGTKHTDSAGAVMGAAVWAASYFGWVPAFRILKPASAHPVRRNTLMIGAHMVWGAVATWTIRELAAARRTMLTDGPLRDAAPQRPSVVPGGPQERQHERQ